MPTVNLPFFQIATISSAQPNSTSDDLNFGMMVVGTAGAPAGMFGNDSTSQYCKGMVSFDLSSIPDTATITSAKLHLGNIYVSPNLSDYGGIDMLIKYCPDNQVFEAGIISWNQSYTTNGVVADVAYNYATWDGSGGIYGAEAIIDVTTGAEYKSKHRNNPYLQYFLDVVDTSEGLNFYTDSTAFLEVTYEFPSSAAMFLGSD